MRWCLQGSFLFSFFLFVSSAEYSKLPKITSEDTERFRGAPGGGLVLGASVSSQRWRERVKLLTYRGTAKPLHIPIDHRSTPLQAAFPFWTETFLLALAFRSRTPGLVLVQQELQQRPVCSSFPLFLDQNSVWEFIFLFFCSVFWLLQ